MNIQGVRLVRCPRCLGNPYSHNPSNNDCPRCGSAMAEVSVDDVSWPGVVMNHDAGPTKYRNKPTWVDGFLFASKKEAARWAELKLLEAAGEISELERQVSYTLKVNGQTICRYVADFVYHSRSMASRIVEDCKGGCRTPAYRLKAKLMLACHGIAIKET